MLTRVPMQASTMSVPQLIEFLNSSYAYKRAVASAELVALAEDSGNDEGIVAEVRNGAKV